MVKKPTKVLGDKNLSTNLRYKQGKNTYSRDYFCSYPDNVLVLKFDADIEKSLNISLTADVIQNQFKIFTYGNRFELRGEIDGNNRPFVVSVLVDNNGGDLLAEKDRLIIESANSVIFYVSISTNYKLEYPNYEGEDPVIKNQRVLDNIKSLGYDRIKERHIQDYQNLYHRVSIDLNEEKSIELLPTDQRWERMKRGKRDLGLKEMTFNLGRYLLISASRPGTLPANLQGGWNTFKNSYWAGNYQSNINIQEIYWPCGPTNLLECHEPWLNWIADLVEPGREVAKRVYGTNGWVSHTTGNIWGHAAPIGGLFWGMYPMASAWHCHHLWEQYLFNQDTLYLRDFAYPIMKEASQFWLQNLVDYKGYLISTPSVSAEHGPYDKNVEEPIYENVSMFGTVFNMPGSFQDTEMLWDLFSNVSNAAKILGDDQYADSVNRYRERLHPLKIGKYGQLQEWHEDVDDSASHHRHIAHLFAVSPGHQIHPTTTPELASAAKKSLEMRGNERFPQDDYASGGNWSRAHRIAAWARLMEGDKANTIFTQLITEQGFENLLTFQHAPNDSGRPDLFKENDSTFLAFQLDASAAIPAFMSEMLLQSHMGEIHLLPALPSEWQSGSVTGLLARGGFEVDLKWKNGSLELATITSRFGSEIPPIRLVNSIISESDRRIIISSQ